MKKNIFILLLTCITAIGCNISKEKSTNQEYNQTINSILERHSVRTFKSDSISLDTLQLLVKAAMAAPTGLDKRPWDFIVLDNKTDVYNFYKATGNDRFKTAPAAIIICGNTYTSDLWYIDCSCAAENLLVAVQSMGLGAVFTANYPIKERMDAVKNYFNLPDNIIPLCSIPIGYAATDTCAKNKYNNERIHLNKW